MLEKYKIFLNESKSKRVTNCTTEAKVTHATGPLHTVSGCS